MTKTKIALVTGGSRGLGRDMAISIAKKGIDVILTYHSNHSAAQEVLTEIEELGQKAHAIQLDTRKTETFDHFYDALTSYLKKQYGNPTFDYLVNNAGTGVNAPITETTEGQFDEMYDIHLKGTYFFTQKALLHIKNEGSIINISSGLTRFSFPGSSAYAMMKGGIEIFTRYLAKELSDRRITANVIAPGAIATDFGGGTNRDNQQKRTTISNLTALGRVGEAEDIGAIIAFLCTNEAHWINGQRIEVSGGMLL